MAALHRPTLDSAHALLLPVTRPPGDSRALVARNNAVLFASDDHKPSNAGEMKRIQVSARTQARRRPRDVGRTPTPLPRAPRTRVHLRKRAAMWR